MRLDLIKLANNDHLMINDVKRSISQWIAQNPVVLKNYMVANRDKYKLSIHAELELKKKLNENV
jgi:hypothetical protein